MAPSEILRRMRRTHNTRRLSIEHISSPLHRRGRIVSNPKHDARNKYVLISLDKHQRQPYEFFVPLYWGEAERWVWVPQSRGCVFIIYFRFLHAKRRPLCFFYAATNGRVLSGVKRLVASVVWMNGNMISFISGVLHTSLVSTATSSATQSPTMAKRLVTYCSSDCGTKKKETI